MSTWPPIWKYIKSHEAAGHLVALPMRAARKPRVRPMFLTPELNAVLSAVYLDPQYKQRYMALRASLEVFLSGAPITSSYLKPLHPLTDGVWEIVNKKPNPSLRVFGLFATRNVFVATNHQRRDTLGGFNSQQWKQELRRARFEWNRLFDDEPLIGALHEVVSGAVYV